MSKLINEFFDEIERFLPAFTLFMFFSAAANAIWNYSFDISSLNQDNFEYKIKEIIIHNRVKIVVVWLLTFSINLFSLMGLWKCIIAGRSGFHDFFKGGISLFSRAILPYFAINIYPVFFLFLFFFLSRTSKTLASFTSFLFIICSMWLWARISLWQPFISEGKGPFEAVKLSFISTNGSAYLILWVLIFPYVLFYNLGASVTWPFLVYAFLFFNSTFLPASMEIIRYMLYKRISKGKTQSMQDNNLCN